MKNILTWDTPISVKLPHFFRGYTCNYLGQTYAVCLFKNWLVLLLVKDLSSDLIAIQKAAGKDVRIQHTRVESN